jgi:hypothetical protein
MFERIANGWELAKESARVLRLDKELLVFPLLSGIACLMVLASFAVPLWLVGHGEALADDPDQFREPLNWLILFAFYFVNYFVIVFFNSALVACAVIRFRGGDPTLADGFRAAGNRLPQIAGWALVSATVGVILRAIESRSQRAGRFVAGLLGTAWTIATYFVVPVLVVERLGPIEAFQRSVAVLRRTWGEALTANFGIGVIVFLAALPAIALLFGGVYCLAQEQLALGGTLLVLGVAGLLVVSLVSSALNAIVLAALYLYAADDAVPSGFDRQVLQTAFAGRG